MTVGRWKAYKNWIDHAHVSSMPRTLAERAAGNLSGMPPCRVCGGHPDDHWNVPESERTWTLAPYAGTGVATFPAPLDEGKQ